MKSKLLETACTLIVITTLFIAGCKKEYRCRICPGNKTPYAEAGNDTTIKLPVNSLILDGSASSDPDGIIVSYYWRKRVGPPSFHITQVEVVKTEVKDLTEGEYLFELEIRDNSGQPARDLVVVHVIR